MTAPRPTRLIATLAGLTACASLAACGSGTPGTTADQDKSGGGGDRTTIQFWHRSFTPVEDAWYKKTVADYNAAQSKVKVVDTEIPADAWDQKVKAAQASNKMPDIYTHPGRIEDGVRLGQFAKLDGLVAADKLGELTEPGKAVAMSGGSYYGYPLLLEPQTVLFWNKDMFTKAGLDPEKPPTSWDELYAACDKLKPTLQAGQYCISTAADKATFAWSTVGQQMNFAGHTALNKEWTQPTVTDAGYVGLVNAYKKLYDTGDMPKQALAPYVVAKPFGEKKVAMMVSGSWAMSEIGSDYKDMLTRTGVGPFVSADGDQKKPTSTLGNFKWVIDAKSSQQKAAADFLQWSLADDPARLKPFFVDTQFTKSPVRQKVIDAVKADPGAAKAPWSSVITDAIVPHSIPEPTYPAEVSEAVGLAMEKGMKGTSDPAAALEEAAATIKQVIAKDNLPAQASKQ